MAVSVSLLALFVAIALTVRQSRLLKRYRTLFSGPTPIHLDELLVRSADEIASLQLRVKEIAAYLEALELEARKNVQTPGIVRFQAFSDTGSDLSFTAALLDKNLDGLVITSLYGRAESRIYAKPIRAGQSTYTLSDEEKAAIRQLIDQRGQ